MNNGIKRQSIVTASGEGLQANEWGERERGEAETLVWGKLTRKERERERGGELNSTRDGD